MFGAEDGYSLGGKDGGQVSILAWAIAPAQQVFQRTLTVGDGLVHDSVVTFPCSYDLTNYLIAVQVIMSFCNVHSSTGIAYLI